MNNLFLLLKVQLAGFLNLNYLLHSKGKKGKRKLALYAFTALLLLLLCAGYSALVAFGCISLGMGEILPGMLVFLCSFVTLLFTFLKSGGLLFQFRDYDLIMSLPVKGGIVVASRILSLYLGSLLFVLAAGLPVSLVYGSFGRLSAGSWFMLLSSLLFLPLLPMALSMLCSALLHALSARVRHRNAVLILGSLLGTFAILAASFRLQNVTSAEVVSFGVQFQALLSRAYPPAAWLSAAVTSGRPSGYLLFVTASTGCMVLFTLLLTHFYQKLNSALTSHRHRENFRLREARTRSPFLALYRKELRQLLSCPIYLLNSSMGAFLLLAMVILLAFFGLERIGGLANLPFEANTIGAMLPWLFLFMIGMSSTTASSISLEGPCCWIAASAPVDKAVIYRSKIAVNLTVLLPTVLLSSLAACFILPPTPVYLFTLLAVPACYSLFTAVFGLFLNLKKPWYDWNYEYQVVKQTSPVFFSIFGGMLLAVVSIGIIWLAIRKAAVFPAAPLLWAVLFCLLCLTASLLLWKRIKKMQF